MILFAFAVQLCCDMYCVGRKERRITGCENVLSSVYILNLVLRVNAHKHTSDLPGGQDKLPHNELSAVAWLDFSSYSFNYLV